MLEVDPNTHSPKLFSDKALNSERFALILAKALFLHTGRRADE